MYLQKAEAAAVTYSSSASLHLAEHSSGPDGIFHVKLGWASLVAAFQLHLALRHLCPKVQGTQA